MAVSRQDAQDFKKKIFHSKHIVKKWEESFKRQYGTRPSRKEFVDAPDYVKEAYKYYRKYSASLSNENNLVFPGEDGNVKSNVLLCLNEEIDKSCVKNSNCTEKELKTFSVNIKEGAVCQENIENAWGRHLDKDYRNGSGKVRSSKSLVYFQMGEKLKSKATVKIRTSLKRNRSSQLSSSDNGLIREFSKPTVAEALDSDEMCGDLSIGERACSSDISESSDSQLHFNEQFVNSNNSNVSGLPITLLSSSDRRNITSLSKNFDLNWLKRSISSFDEEFPNIDSQIKANASVIGPIDKADQSITSIGHSFENKCNPMKRKDGDDDDKCANKKPKVDDVNSENFICQVEERVSAENSASHLEKGVDSLKMTERVMDVGRSCTKNEAKLRSKVQKGTLNENFRKINLKKKCFARGRKRMTCEKYKRREWKRRQHFKGEEERMPGTQLKCFHCGDFGHWANACPKRMGDSLLPHDESESTFLTLEEAEILAKGIKREDDSYGGDGRLFSVGTAKVTSQSSVSPSNKEMDCEDVHRISILPIYPHDNADVTPSDILEMMKRFGYHTFRNGQERAIMRVLSGQSTLLVLPTASGKSLCYQLPALIYAQKYKCITLCISPLVALMEDQVRELPSFLKAVCLHTQQTPTVREKAIHSLQSGHVHILLVSPEAIVSSQYGGILGACLKNLPPIAFACLDEVHCISEWSHNFRPSYLQLCSILREKLKVSTLLGLTATARKMGAINMAKHLGIDDVDKGLIMDTCIPDNLLLSISRDQYREEALSNLITSKHFSECSSIIIYCTRREECERIACFLRTQISRPSAGHHARQISLDAEAYHAGLSDYRRKQVQQKFISGKLRIVVATVAFGMGINKYNLHGIVHYNMPKNLESYVQEIGRAGRDGLPSRCHLFLDSSHIRNTQELKRHIFANSVDRFVVRKLLDRVFMQCVCSKTDVLTNPFIDVTQNSPEAITEPDKSTCSGHEVALPIHELITLLDLPEENIQTLLCYLESIPTSRLKLHHNVYANCDVACYKGPQQLLSIARSCPPLAAAIALQRSRGLDFRKKSSVTFPVVATASKLGLDSGIVKKELKKLQWEASGPKYLSSGVKVEFRELAFHLTCPGDLTEAQKDEILETLYRRARQQEETQLWQLHYAYKVFDEASCLDISQCVHCPDERKSDQLKAAIRDYFNDTVCIDSHLESPVPLRSEVELSLRADIRSFIATHTDNSWTGRAVARVFHGIGSPNFPATTWSQVRRFWRSHLDTDFNRLMALATQEILKFK